MPGNRSGGSSIAVLYYLMCVSGIVLAIKGIDKGVIGSRTPCSNLLTSTKSPIENVFSIVGDPILNDWKNSD